MNRAFYSDTIVNFIVTPTDEILGKLARHNEFSSEPTQRDAWLEEINILKSTLNNYQGTVYFEYSIPRMGKRIDVLLLIGPVIIILEFKVGEKEFTSYAFDQVMDYALDLKNFHETSHEQFIVPILIATKAKSKSFFVSMTPQNDKILFPIQCNVELFNDALANVLKFVDGNAIIPNIWEEGRYSPTPTIVEAAMALYAGHSVEEISRSDAGATNLKKTSIAISKIISYSKDNSQKAICFVTGVPGAGKTLIGLDIANKHIDKNSDLYSVFLSGNGPLVAILREALTRDKIYHEKQKGNKLKKGIVMSEVKMFIQNIHNFRDECLIDSEQAPIEHVALFDEAQRAWNVEQTSNFMRRKKNKPNFMQSEPEFLISCLDRHKDWAVIVCLVGGGQEINTGEAGISEWIDSLNRSFPHWNIYISSQLTDNEYGAGKALQDINKRSNVVINNSLHLSVSMRSFRAENVSLLVKQILDNEIDNAQKTLTQVIDKYPIVLTRDLSRAKQWLKEQARGTERYGIVVSSQAERLRPHAIDVKSPMDPIHWFLDDKEDVRSSFYLEDVATEFDVQGLEVDWACVVWDGDFRYSSKGWEHKSFMGSRWININKKERQLYLKNAYRVLLTRARQGMVIVVPQGDDNDPTRCPLFYDSTYNYLSKIGFNVI